MLWRVSSFGRQTAPAGRPYWWDNRNRAPADQRFLEPYSGLYYQITGEGFDPFPSRSLWDRRLEVGRAHQDFGVHTYDSDQFSTEMLRILERDVLLPGSQVPWRSSIRPGFDTAPRSPVWGPRSAAVR